MNTMSAAFEKAGVAKDTLREMVARALVSKSPCSALWIALNKDKRAAEAAMVIVLRTYSPGVPLRQTVVDVETPRARTRRLRKITRQVVQRIAETALDTYRLTGGRSLKAIPWRELPRIAARSEKDAALIHKLLKRYRVTDSSVSVAQVVSAAIFDSILKEIKT